MSLFQRKYMVFLKFPADLCCKIQTALRYRKNRNRQKRLKRILAGKKQAEIKRGIARYRKDPAERKYPEERKQDPAERKQSRSEKSGTQQKESRVRLKESSIR